MAKIKIGQTADATLDAFGSGRLFTAHVISVDPAETTTNGVNSYKATLQFDGAASDIKPGMTANVDIVTGSSAGALVVPAQTVITKGEDKFVMIKDPSGQYIEQKIDVGATGNGYDEVVSGLKEGDIIASFGQ